MLEFEINILCSFAYFSRLIILGDILIVFVFGTTNNGVLLNLRSNLCAVIDLGSRYSDIGGLLLRVC